MSSGNRIGPLLQAKTTKPERQSRRVIYLCFIYYFFNSKAPDDVQSRRSKQSQICIHLITAAGTAQRLQRLGYGLVYPGFDSQQRQNIFLLLIVRNGPGTQW